MSPGNQREPDVARDEKLGVSCLWFLHTPQLQQRASSFYQLELTFHWLQILGRMRSSGALENPSWMQVDFPVQLTRQFNLQYPHPLTHTHLIPVPSPLPPSFWTRTPCPGCDHLEGCVISERLVCIFLPTIIVQCPGLEAAAISIMLPNKQIDRDPGQDPAWTEPDHPKDLFPVPKD